MGTAQPAAPEAQRRMAKHKLTLANAKKKGGQGVARKGVAISRKAIGRKGKASLKKPLIAGGWAHDKFDDIAGGGASGVQVVGSRGGTKAKVVLRRAGAAVSKGAQTFQVNLGGGGRAKGQRTKATIRTGTAEIWGLDGKGARVGGGGRGTAAKPKPKGNVDGQWSHDLFDASQRGGRRSGGRGRGRGGKKGRGRGGGYGHDDRDGVSSGMDIESRINGALGA